MKNLPRKILILFLLYLVIATGLTLLGIRKEARNPSPPSPGKREEKKHSDKLGPSELFYLDRNYPASEPHANIFQQKLKQAIAYDRIAQSHDRGLDYPWTIEGPGNIGGRINTIAVHPVTPQIILMGYSNGGIYRTDDGGATWIPVFDDQPSLSIAHISFDPHDPDRVWAATGDVNISGYPFIGAGVFHSEDGGVSWSYAGLEDTGVLSKVTVDPNNADIIYVGSMGFPSHKGAERGLFRSTDGGDSWQKTLTIDDSTGVIDMVADPLTPGQIFASGWTRLRSSRRGTTMGPGTGLYKSEDYGATWSQVANGLPDNTHSRTSLEITYDGTLFISYIGSVTNGECAGYTESLQSVHRSIDGGIHWDTIPIGESNGLPCGLFGSFGWYFEVLKVNPENPLDIFLLGIDLYRTLDGGITWFEAAPIWWFYDVHADKHDLAFAHGELFLGTDGGAYKTDILQGNVWTDIENIPSTQFYRTVWNPHVPDQYFGGAQDNGTTGGNSSFINEWPRIFGGDGFQPLFDRDDPALTYVTIQNGYMYYSDDGGFEYEDLNQGLEGSRYWDVPLVMSTHDPKILYCGSHRMFRMDMHDTLRTWQPISPDLTRGDSLSSTRYPAITAIALSDLDDQRLYVGTQDGFLWTTPDGGNNWINITEGTPGFYVTSISCSTVDPSGVMVTYSGYRDNDHTPYIYSSNNAGADWEPVASDLPMMGVNNLFILPGWNDAVLFAATDGGVYVSSDAGDNWERLGSNMPYMPVYDLDYNPAENKIIAATFSRGIMTFPVEELDLVSGTHNLSAANTALINIYPTIVNSHFVVDFSGLPPGGQEAKISIFNSSGIPIDQYTGSISAADPYLRFKLKEGIPPGMYLVSIDTGEIQTVSRIIVAG